MIHPITSTWIECGEQGGNLSAAGDWYSGSTSSLEIVCCTICPWVSGPRLASVGLDRSTNASCVCDAGSEGPDTSGPCTGCAIGKYKAEAGSHACISCPYGRSTVAVGSSWCTDPVCKVCPINSMSLEASPSLRDCRCNAGFYGNSSAGLPCRICPTGSYGPESAETQADCTCNHGFYGNPAENITCQTCPENSEPLASVAHPRVINNCSCNAGFYGMPTAFSNPACQACPANTYNPNPASPKNSSCTACPAFSSSPAGSPSRSNCLCNKGYFGDLGTSDSLCQACPANTFGPTAGASSQGQCRFCPSHSAVVGTVGVSVVDCSCNSGYRGVINATYQRCYACPNFNCSLVSS